MFQFLNFVVVVVPDDSVNETPSSIEGNPSLPIDTSVTPSISTEVTAPINTEVAAPNSMEVAAPISTEVAAPRSTEVPPSVPAKVLNVAGGPEPAMDVDVEGAVNGVFSFV